MSECKHESIDPYGCFCDGCGETCDEIIRNQQAELAALREANLKLEAFLRKLHSSGSWYTSAIELDTYRPTYADGEELEKELLALLPEEEK